MVSSFVVSGLAGERRRKRRRGKRGVERASLKAPSLSLLLLVQESVVFFGRRLRMGDVVSESLGRYVCNGRRSGQGVFDETKSDNRVGRWKEDFLEMGGRRVRELLEFSCFFCTVD